MELAMALRLRGLSAECEMNVDGVVMEKAVRENPQGLFAQMPCWGVAS
jgi:hypothetical protein